MDRIWGYAGEVLTFGRVALDLIGLAAVIWFSVRYVRGRKPGRDDRAAMAIKKAQATLWAMRPSSVRAPRPVAGAGSAGRAS